MPAKKSQNKSANKEDRNSAPPPGPGQDLTIVWLRQDLRLADQPALYEASRRGGAVVAVYIWAPHEECPWSPGAASKVWLHFSLTRLDEALRSLGSRLFIFDCRQGKATSLTVLQELSRRLGARAIFWNRRYEPAIIERDNKIKTH
jgi:deoxyribodipyrimidine photo-lyase